MKKTILAMTLLAAAIVFAVGMASCSNLLERLEEGREAKTCTVAYKSEQGTAPAKATVQENTILTEAQLPVLETTGYTFNGWYDGDVKAEAGKYKVARNVELVAKWSANTYEVTFDKNAEDAAGSMDAQDFVYAAEQKLSANTFTRTGYTFAGWNTQADGGGTSYNDGQSVESLTAEDKAVVTLYAQWIREGDYRITYNLDGGANHSGKPTSYNVESETITLQEASRTGYTFAGWENSNGDTVTQIATGTTGDITLTAKWEPNTYTVTFNANGGTLTDNATQSVKHGAKATEPAEPTREGHVFSGWHTSSDGGVTLSETAYDFDTVATGDVHLYAKWHEHTYSEDWTRDAIHHWHACVCGAKKDEAEHNFGNWTVTKEPTETQEGSKEGTCTVCEYTDSVVLQPAPEGFRFVKGDTVTGALPAWLDKSAYYGDKGVFIEGRTVTLSDFYMGKYEVTQEEYASVMQGQKVTVNGTEYTLASDPSYCSEGSTSYTLFSGDEQGKRPVEGVTWYDAVWYCNALSAKERLEPAYNIEVTTINGSNHITAATVSLVPNANGYRLPTEAEWEYAARGGEPNAADWNYTFSGADTAADASYSSSKNSGLDNVGWYWYNTATGTTGNSPSSGSQGYGTHQVGKKAANALGLYDMSGNVWEWCYDWYGTVNTGTETAPTGAASGSGRVSRGGSWVSYANFASVSFRNTDWEARSILPGSRDYNLGFRVVRPSSN